MRRAIAALSLLAGCPSVDLSEPGEQCYYDSGMVREGKISEGDALGWRITAENEIEPGGKLSLVLELENTLDEDCPSAVYSSATEPSLSGAPVLESDAAPPPTHDALGRLVEDRIVPRQYGAISGLIALSIPLDLEEIGDRVYVSVVGCDSLHVYGYIEALDTCIDNIDVRDL